MESEKLFERILTQQGLSWMNPDDKKQLLFKNHLPFYFNNNETKQTIKKALQINPASTDGIGGRTFVFAKPFGTGKTAFANYLANLIPPISGSSEPEFYVILLEQPVMFHELIIQTALFILNAPEKDIFEKQMPEYSAICGFNSTLSHDKKQTPNLLGKLIDHLREKHRYVLFFLDDFKFDAKSLDTWYDSIYSMLPRENIGYLVAHTDYYTRARGSPSPMMGKRFLELDFLSKENVIDAFNYFFKDLNVQETEFLQQFVFPFLEGRPLFLFLFFSKIREIFENRKNSTETFYKIMNRALKGAVSMFKERLSQSYREISKIPREAIQLLEYAKPINPNINFADTVFELFSSWESFGGKKQNNKIMFSNLFPIELVHCHLVGLIYLEDLPRACRPPELFVIYSLKSESLKSPPAFMIPQQAFSPLASNFMALLQTNQKGKSLGIIMSFLLSDRTSFFHKEIQEYAFSGWMNSSQLRFGKYEPITQIKMLKQLKRDQKGVFVDCDDVSGCNSPAGVQKIDVLLTERNKETQQMATLGIQVTTEKAGNTLNDKYKGFVEWIQNSSAQYPHVDVWAFISLNHVVVTGVNIPQEKRILLFENFGTYLSKDFPELDLEDFETLGTAEDDLLQKIVAIIQKRVEAVSKRELIRFSPQGPSDDQFQSERKRIHLLT